MTVKQLFLRRLILLLAGIAGVFISADLFWSGIALFTLAAIVQDISIAKERVS